MRAFHRAHLSLFLHPVPQVLHREVPRLLQSLRHLVAQVAYPFLHLVPQVAFHLPEVPADLLLCHRHQEASVHLLLPLAHLVRSALVPLLPPVHIPSHSPPLRLRTIHPMALCRVRTILAPTTSQAHSIQAPSLFTIPQHHHIPTNSVAMV